MERKHRTDDEWRELICSCKSSGLSDLQWLKRNGISPSSFYRKMRQLTNAQERNTVSCAKTLVEAPEVHEVVPVSFQEEPAGTLELPQEAAAIVLTAGDYKLEIRNSAEAATIRNTLMALRQLC